MTKAHPTVEYFAKSVFASSTFWVNFLAGAIAILSLNEVTTLIPENYMPLYGAVVAIINIFLRMTTVRPVAFMAPGEVKAVDVKKLKATQTDIKSHEPK